MPASEIKVKFDPSDLREIHAYVDRRVEEALREIQAQLDRAQAELRGYLIGAGQVERVETEETGD